MRGDEGVDWGVKWRYTLNVVNSNECMHGSQALLYAHLGRRNASNSQRYAQLQLVGPTFPCMVQVQHMYRVVLECLGHSSSAHRIVKIYCKQRNICKTLCTEHIVHICVAVKLVKIMFIHPPMVHFWQSTFNLLIFEEYLGENYLCCGSMS